MRPSLFARLADADDAVDRLHGAAPVQERCCRWLLMTHDRVHQDEFHLSHEFLAMMLGSTRPTVTVVAGTLQKAGLIKYSHGTHHHRGPARAWKRRPANATAR